MGGRVFTGSSGRGLSLETLGYGPVVDVGTVSFGMLTDSILQWTIMYIYLHQTLCTCTFVKLVNVGSWSFRRPILLYRVYNNSIPVLQ